MTPAVALCVYLLAVQAGGGTDDADRGAQREPVHRIEITGKGPSTPPSSSPPSSTPTPTPTPTPSTSTSTSSTAHATSPNPLAPVVTATPGQTDARTVAQLTARVSELEAQLATAQSQRAQLQARVQQLEQQLAAERSRRESADAAPAARAPALEGAATALQGADQALASGSADDVSAAIARAQALAADSAAQAGSHHSEAEAALASDAQRWLASSQEALSRGDLYQARQAVQRALDAAARARGLNATAAGGTGAR